MIQLSRVPATRIALARATAPAAKAVSKPITGL